MLGYRKCDSGAGVKGGVILRLGSRRWVFGMGYRRCNFGDEVSKCDIWTGDRRCNSGTGERKVSYWSWGIGGSILGLEYRRWIFGLV